MKSVGQFFLDGRGGLLKVLLSIWNMILWILLWEKSTKFTISSMTSWLLIGLIDIGPYIESLTINEWSNILILLMANPFIPKNPTKISDPIISCGFSIVG